MKRCLDDNEIAQFAEYFTGHNVAPEEDIREHVIACNECSQSILEISEWIDTGIVEISHTQYLDCISNPFL